MPSLRLRCTIPYGPEHQRRIEAVESAAKRIGGSRSCFVRVVPTEGGVFCDLYLHGTDPPGPGEVFVLRTTGEEFTRQVVP
jgi:hypothetical protein